MGNEPHAIIWTNGRSMTLAGRYNSWWRAVNDHGLAVGERWSEILPMRPILWIPGRGVIALPLAGFDYGFAHDINDSGHAVGRVYSGSGSKAKSVIWHVRR